MNRQNKLPFLFEGKIDQENHRKYRMIQIISIAPLLVSLISLYCSKGSIISVSLFFVFLFVGLFVAFFYINIENPCISKLRNGSFVYRFECRYPKSLECCFARPVLTLS